MKIVFVVTEPLRIDFGQTNIKLNRQFPISYFLFTKTFDFTFVEVLNYHVLVNYYVQSSSTKKKLYLTDEKQYCIETIFVFVNLYFTALQTPESFLALII